MHFYCRVTVRLGPDMVPVVVDRSLWDLWCYKVALEQGYVGIIPPPPRARSFTCYRRYIIVASDIVIK
jgi:hypothetical protein